MTAPRLAAVVFSALAAGCIAVAAADEIPAASAAAGVVPATGQTQSHAVERPRGGSSEVPDDGRVRAGAPLQYRDNGDGTVTDLTTGLMWEKKCSGCGGLHDHRERLRWSGDGEAQTIWDWLDEVNREGGAGFAGHSDWRIPNVKELVSIVDYGRVNPAVAPAFAGGACRSGCADVTAANCSCTALGEYWTSTTFSDFPAHALVVDLGLGFVDDRVKTNRHLVRAVRGGK